MRTKVEGKVSFRKIEESDIPKIDADYLDGKNLVEEGYYIVWVDSDPSKYVYMKTFGPVDPNVEPTFNLAPYAYIDHCGFLGDYLYIDTAAIENDETRNLPRQISVHFVEDVPGENTAIFKSDETGNYYTFCRLYIYFAYLPRILDIFLSTVSLSALLYFSLPP